MVGAYKLLFNGDPVLGAGPLVDVVVSCQLLIALIYCIPCIVAQSSAESGWRLVPSLSVTPAIAEDLIKILHHRILHPRPKTVTRPFVVTNIIITTVQYQWCRSC